MNASRNSVPTASFVAGLVAGTVDIGAAATIYRTSPVNILHAVASGALGPASFHGGVPTALLGLVLQWAMSILIAAIYVGVLRRVAAFRLPWIPAGVIYGLLVFVVMNYAVLPLSRTFADHHLPHFTFATFGANLLAMIVFGLIVAFIARKVVGESAIARA
jgi:uncharacterized membrane protein YagU involved in acid resistance